MKKNTSLIYSLFFLLLITTASFAQASFFDRKPSAFEEAVNRMLSAGDKRIGKLDNGMTLYGKWFIQRMYEENKGKPIWTPSAIRSLATALNGLEMDGLNPDEYRFAETKPFLDNPVQPAPSQGEMATVDIMLTEGYLRAMYNLYYGKSDPERLDLDNNFAQARDGKDRTPLLLSWVKKNRINEAFNWARPKNNRYKWMKKALIRYQKIKAAGGWPQVPKGKTIRPGDSDDRISLIRRRLAITGDMPSSAGGNTLDVALQQGVRRFQQRHNLKVDAVIGPGTLGTMNVPIEKRIDQIRVNIERQRWLYPVKEKEYLNVDIAGFKIYWMKNDRVIWQEQVQVGKRFTKTPIFKDQIEYIDFNPTWSIPPGIKRRTILPSLRRDPGYLDKKGYKLLDDKGNSISPYSIDWNSITRIPYTVRQPPGRNNALGLVKFMFPNKHSVFLHDTNHREYFAKQVRTTSSGCIRLRNPFVLAEKLLSRQGWNRTRINRVRASGRTTRAKLKAPLPILIQYSTASANGDEISFKSDIYKRDAKVLAAINGPFKFHLPDLSKRARSRIRAGIRSASAPSGPAAGAQPEVIGTPTTESSFFGTTKPQGFFVH